MDFVDIIVEYLPIFMFLTMGVLLFIGYPVGFILGGVAITYGFIGYLFGVFKIADHYTPEHPPSIAALCSGIATPAAVASLRPLRVNHVY